ncbi:prepilin-type N-terminal cleavage/methylation domain-containing protein [Curvibacter sp. HBC61]|uniref:Prepilin-type N-terminal cleavage/methylation domain-containing protein n=1 Tax=Curvibacter cyanobacteriorum TaxID=3026422 RepID=A0ABT5MYD2_9BURK|nr:prepilin-type N-terminal cleavage/methylation domain-containing protein [Curvibacter sp. HBC61]MDD0839071.1 prepilin-type N-terminal cleavage/methylation domain-containing protein [Curvibacter sp. HBC61]
MTALPWRAARSAGFTLVELLIVIGIMALATAGVSLALRDTQQVQLEREAQRLAALLETARARSRASGVAVQWSLTEHGFQFSGLPANSLPSQWLSPGTTTTRLDVRLTLGPEPVIGPQQVTLVRADAPGQALRVATDGLRPFNVLANDP